MAPPHMEVTLDKWQKWVSALIEGDDCVVANLNSAADDLGVFNCLCIRLLFERIDA